MEHKQYIYKVYSPAGNYLGTWNDVVSEPSITREVNTVGSQLAVTLKRRADSYGEGTDVDFGLNVELYVVDKENPAGKILFSGFISSYAPTFEANDRVEIILLSYGVETAYALHEDRLSLKSNTGDPTGYERIGGATTDTQQITTIAGQTKIGAIGIWFRNTYPLSYDITLELWNNGLTTKLGTATIPAGTQNINRQGGVVGGDMIIYYYEYPGYFDTEITVTELTNYQVKISAPTAPLNGLYLAVNDSLDVSVKTYATAGTTSFTYTNSYPSDIIRDALDRYKVSGGKLTYDNSSVPEYDGGQTVSYEFKLETVEEVIKKSQELATAGHYFFTKPVKASSNFTITPASEYLYFKDVNDWEINNVFSPKVHILSLDKDIISLKVEKRTEDMVNCIYFVGGDMGGGTILYKKFENKNSISKYGLKAKKIVDQRVTIPATAEAMANAILENSSEPELRIDLVVADSNGSDRFGYDIESIDPGDVIKIRNITQQTGLSMWDIARWDEDYWDYNIYNLSSLQLQVRKFTYEGDKLSIKASTLPIDINKKIDEISRSLEVTQSNSIDVAPE